MVVIIFNHSLAKKIAMRVLWMKKRVQWKKVPFLTLFLKQTSSGKRPLKSINLNYVRVCTPQLKNVSIKSGEWLFEKAEKKYSLKKLCVYEWIGKEMKIYILNDIFERKVGAIINQVSFIKVSLFLSLSL